MKFTYKDFIEISYIPLVVTVVFLLAVTHHNTAEQNKINAFLADQDLLTLNYLNQTLQLTKKNIDMLNLTLDQMDDLEKKFKKNNTKRVYKYLSGEALL